MYEQTKAYLEECKPRVTPEVIERATAARAFAHKASCPDPAHTDSCLACPSVSSVALALFWLDEHPRDAQGARVLMHDCVCTSRCEDGDHARRTQAKHVAAIRRFRAGESST